MSVDMVTANAAEVMCPVCEAGGQTPHMTYNGFPLRRCPACTFIYTQERIIPEAHYEAAYKKAGMYDFMLRAAEQTVKGDLDARHLWWFKRLALRWIRRSNAKTLIDVGCGPGTFLIIAQQLGLEVEGIEPARPAAEKAISFGLTVFNGYVEDYVSGRSRSFDCVTCFEVIEHVSDPVGMLRAIRELTQSEGRFILSVPNVDDPYMLQQTLVHSMPPVHINFFNRKSMSMALERAGFAVDRIVTIPIPTSTVKRLHGSAGLLLRVPYLALLAAMRKLDGSSLIIRAKPQV